jgi:hypothetical protein
MRQLLVYFLCSICFAAHAQEIELKGRYAASFLGAEAIEFVGKDSFYFDAFYCTYGVRGKGTCEIRDGYLFLYFENSGKKAKKDSLKPPVVEIMPGHDSNTSVIRLLSTDELGNQMAFQSAVVTLANGARLNTAADSLGKVTLRISNKDFPLHIRTTMIGYNAGELSLDKPALYSIRLFHAPTGSWDKMLTNGETYVYEIDEVSEDYILMRPEHSTEHFRKYLKK